MVDRCQFLSEKSVSYIPIESMSNSGVSNANITHELKTSVLFVKSKMPFKLCLQNLIDDISFSSLL